MRSRAIICIAALTAACAVDTDPPQFASTDDAVDSTGADSDGGDTASPPAPPGDSGGANGDADPSGEPASCGDGEIVGSEVCDGFNFGGATCESLGFTAGELACTDQCRTIDTSSCGAPASCGDGERNGDEDCEGSDLGDATCESEGFTYGDIACAADCRFDTAGCVFICKEAGEACITETDCCNTGCGKGGMFCTTNGEHVCCD